MKRTQRQQMIKKLKQMPIATYAERSEKIVSQLLQTAQFQVAKTIAVTMSNFPEVETRRLIETAWSLGKTVTVPKSHPATREMTFYAITGFDQLEVVFAGIEEPIEASCQKVLLENLDIVIVPGVVFNEQGFRIGFGGGYYDRFLAKYKGVTIALAFDEQVQASIPVDSHDVPIQTIITDQRTINCSGEL